MIEAWQVLGDRYELGEVLGSGGMAEVRRARDIRLGREVAIKVLRPEVTDNEDLVAAFRTEAMASARLNHPGVVAVYDVGEAELDGVRRPYLVMEMIEGVAMSHLLADGTALTVERSVEIAVDVCAALAHAHERGVVHRDVTPSNLMVLPTGAIKVTDFGIARAVSRGADETDASEGYGSVAYISPEQARRRTVDARSDLYSFGCVLMTMLTGTPPFRGTPATVVASHLRARPPAPSSRRPGIDPAIDEVVLRCLAKDPWQRPQTAAELRRDLLRILVELDAVAARAASAGGLASTQHGGVDVTELPTAQVASGLLPPPAPEPEAVPGPAPAAGPAGPDLDLASAEPAAPAVPDDGAPSGSLAPAPAAGHPAAPPLDPETAPGPDEPPAPGQPVPAPTGGATGVGPTPGDEDGPTVGWRAWAVAAVAALLAAVALVVWGIVDSSRADRVEVPVTTGLTIAQAGDLLEDAELVVGESVSEASTDVGFERVIRTDPPQGEFVEPGTEVALVISTGPDQLTMPQVEDLTLEQATLALEEEGLEVGEVVRAESGRPQDTVLRSVPAFGEVIEEGSTVTLVVASGSNTVPELIGQSEERVRDRLEAEGFVVEVAEDPTSTAPDGTVVLVVPAAGVRETLGATVTITVARSSVAQPTPSGTSVATGPGGEQTPSATETLTATVTETETVTEGP